MLTTIGTGITLYTFGPTWGLANVTLDGRLDMTQTVNLGDFISPKTLLFYDRRSLPYENHNVTVLVFDSDNINTPSGQRITFMFDYAAVNERLRLVSLCVTNEAHS
jgi:hypothetical protein